MINRTSYDFVLWGVPRYLRPNVLLRPQEDAAERPNVAPHLHAHAAKQEGCGAGAIKGGKRHGTVMPPAARCTGDS